MFNLSANSLKIISLSINSILDSVSGSFNESNTTSKSYGPMFNDFSSLMNLVIYLYSFLAQGSFYLFFLVFIFEFCLPFFPFILSTKKVYKEYYKISNLAKTNKNYLILYNHFQVHSQIHYKIHYQYQVLNHH